MKKIYKYLKILAFIACFLTITIYITTIGISKLFEHMSIDDIYENYEIKIPLGSFDAKYGGGESFLNNEEARIDALYYTKNLDYLIKKYNLEEMHSESLSFYDIKRKITKDLNSESMEKIEEFLSNDYPNTYFKFIENENGKLLIIYIKDNQTIYLVENKIT